MTATAPASTPIFHPNLPLSVIVESAHNPRKRYDEASLQELAETIRARGIHNPVLVREIDTRAGPRFELAAGHRRCRAARLVGLVEVPALIMQLDDRGFLELLHIDNLQRDGVDPLDEALAYEQLLSNGYDVASLADKLGRSITYVASRVRLLSLSPAAREAMRLGYVKVSHAIELAKLPEGAQEQLLESEWNLNPGALARSAGVETPTAREGEPEDADEAADEALEEDDDEVDEEQFAPPKVVDRWLRARFYHEIAEPTLQTLKRAIAHDVLRRLSVVQWDRADATLVPEAGACTTCPKRSSMTPLLFTELDTGDDACLDASCFEAKTDAYFEIQRGLRQAASAPAAEPRATAERTDHATQPDADLKQRQEAREQAERALELAQVGRTAAVRAVLAGVPKSALATRPWLQVVFTTMLERIHGKAVLEQLLVIMELETSPPEGVNSWDVTWMRDRMDEWARAPQRTAVHLTRAVVLATIGADAVTRVEERDGDADVLLQLAALAEVNVLDVAECAIDNARAETKRARRKAKAVTA